MLERETKSVYERAGCKLKMTVLSVMAIGPFHFLSATLVLRVEDFWRRRGVGFEGRGFLERGFETAELQEWGGGGLVVRCWVKVRHAITVRGAASSQIFVQHLIELISMTDRYERNRERLNDKRTYAVRSHMFLSTPSLNYFTFALVLFGTPSYPALKMGLIRPKVSCYRCLGYFLYW